MMPPLETLLVFIPVALALNLTPGADMMFCLGQGIRAGAGNGFAAAIGIATGSFVHAVLAGIGLAALLASYPSVFEAVRWAGVAYLLWLAALAFRADANLQFSTAGEKTALKAWRDGTLVCLLNPKVGIFMLAIVPQFVDPASGNVFLQFIVYGAIMNIGGTVINIAVGVFAGRIGNALRRRPLVANFFNKLSCLIFIGLALRLGFDRR